MGARDLGVLRTIACNDRVGRYEAVLSRALDRGYAVCGVRDYWERRHERCLVLRHDVDLPRAGVLSLLDVERRLGVAATWYFRWETAAPELVAAVAEAGGEAGLHYESLALECAARGVAEHKGVTDEVRGAALERLGAELAGFRERFGVPCRTAASHGHPLNRRIRMANNEVVTPDTYARLGLDVEAYDEELLEGASYLTDAEATLNRGWSYGRSPDQAMAEGEARIFFISHPHHWDMPPVARAKALARWALFGGSERPATFHRTFED